MFEITAFETNRRLRGIVYLTVGLLVYIVLVVGLFSTIQQAGVDFDAYLKTLPPEVKRGFVGNVTSLSTIEGYLVSQLYQTAWVLLLGVYFAYAAARSVVGEIEAGSMDLLLAGPVSRTRVVVGKFLSLVPAIVVVNLVSFVAIYQGVRIQGERIDLLDLALLHGVSCIYLLACAALGLVFSVVFRSVRRAQAAAIGGIFGMFLVDALTYDTDYDWLGSVSFSRYFDPGAILVSGDVNWGDTALLLVATVVLVVVAAELFERRNL